MYVLLFGGPSMVPDTQTARDPPGSVRWPSCFCIRNSYSCFVLETILPLPCFHARAAAEHDSLKIEARGCNKAGEVGFRAKDPPAVLLYITYPVPSRPHQRCQGCLRNVVGIHTVIAAVDLARGPACLDVA